MNHHVTRLYHKETGYTPITLFSAHKYVRAIRHHGTRMFSETICDFAHKALMSLIDCNEIHLFFTNKGMYSSTEESKTKMLEILYSCALKKYDIPSDFEKYISNLEEILKKYSNAYIGYLKLMWDLDNESKIQKDKLINNIIKTIDETLH